MQDSAALLAKVAREKRLVPGKLKGSEKAEIEQLVATGKVVKLGQAFYLAERAPSEEREADRIEQLLLSKPKLFPRSRLETRFAEVKLANSQTPQRKAKPVAQEPENQRIQPSKNN
jgi:hypothetical protein